MTKFYSSFTTSLVRSLIVLFFTTASLSAISQTGVLDVTFGDKGKVVTRVGNGDAQLLSIVLQPDGKILSSGHLYTKSFDSCHFVLLRYNSDGSQDETFGDHGNVKELDIDKFNSNTQILLQKDGKILLSGIVSPTINSNNKQLALVRYEVTGKLDSSFGKNGYVVTDFGEGSKMSLEQNGKVLVAGTIRSTNILGQFNTNGGVDSSFGVNGRALINIGSVRTPITWMAIAIEPSEKIIVGGNITETNGIQKFIVARLTKTGYTDSTFGVNGIQKSNFNDSESYSGTSLVIQDDLKIVFAGYTAYNYFSSIALLKLNNNGTYDSSFGYSGHVLTSRDEVGCAISSVNTQPDEKLVVAGTNIFYKNNRSIIDFLVVRYNKNGSLDSSFGKHGIITTDIRNYDDNLWTSIIQKDGKIILAGHASDSSKKYFALARYDLNAPLYYNTLKGSIYLDKNRNSIKDVIEPFVTSANVTAVKIGLDTLSIHATKGQFTTDIDTGAYIISVAPYLPYYADSPATFTINHSTYFNTDSVSFALQPVAGKRDLAVSIIPETILRPGFDTRYRIRYTNQGTDTIATGTIKLLKTSKFNFIAATPAATQSGDTLLWNFLDLKPMDTASIAVDFMVQAPPAVNAGDTLHSFVTISSDKTDLTPDDNLAELNDRVRGSYDPNDKTESHGGSLKVSQVQKGDYLQYTIRFQNTGTDTAFNVFVHDTLSNNVDWSTLKMVASSHNFQLTVKDGRYCVWALNSINLVDSNTSEALSHGYIVYSVKAKKSLVAGNTINNTAHIYFDYNLPVATNIEKTTVEDIALPVRLITFTAKHSGKNNIAEWLTNNEVNVERFEVERSTNGTSFAKVATFKGGSSKYSYTDYQPNKGVNYYRLKIVDRDGSFTYSSIRSIDNSNGLYVSLYPNPAANQLTIQLDCEDRTNLQLHIIDIDGKSLMTKTAIMQQGQRLLPVDVSSLQKGSYFLKVTGNGTLRTVIKFQKM